MFKRTAIVRLCSTMTKIAENETTNQADTALHKVQSGRVDGGRGDNLNKNVIGSQRVRTHRYAMLLGYQGKNYFGMQLQRGNGGIDTHPTIESHIMDAFLKLGWINESLKKTPYDFYFQRAARTDKSVSAVRQVVSCQMPVQFDLPTNGPEQMNDILPADIRVFGFRRAVKSFQSHKSCDGRTYSYTLPTFAFAKSHELTNSAFRISESTLKEVAEVLGQYKGTHNFFNYTSGRDFVDRSCNRYIISFEVGQPFLFRDEFRKEDVQFVTCTVKGQSFMLHQIRKMIGMMITIIRELQHPSALEKSFVSGERMDVPRAPGLGLLLERVHYDKYDRQFGSLHGPLSNWGPQIEETIEKMKKEQITSEILDTELTSQSMMMWLSDLIHHNFSPDEGDPAEFISGAAKVVSMARKEAAKKEEEEGEEKEEEEVEVKKEEEEESLAHNADTVKKEASDTL